MAVCNDCGGGGVGVRLEDLELCDRCADHRIAAATGWPELPPAPAAELLVGPDGRRHVFTYRLFRWPGRVTAVAEEKPADGAPGYRLEVAIDHAEDPTLLGQRIRKAARIAVACQYLKWDDGTGRWGLSGDEVGGYLVEIDDMPIPIRGSLSMAAQ